MWVDKFCDETFCICSHGSGYASWIWICIVDPDSHRGSGFTSWIRFHIVNISSMFRDFLINQRKISFTISVGNLWMERIYSNRIKRSLSGGGSNMTINQSNQFKGVSSWVSFTLLSGFLQVYTSSTFLFLLMICLLLLILLWFVQVGLWRTSELEKSSSFEIFR